MLELLPDKKCIGIILAILFSVVAITLKRSGIFAQNAYINVMLSFPFFYIGMLLKAYKATINKKEQSSIYFLVFSFAVIITLLCSIYNGNVWVYMNDYGNSYLLYLIGGLSGTTLIFIICKWLDKVKLSIVSTISTGSIIILGLHFSLI